MTATTNYITNAQLKATLAITGTTGDADITAAVAAASRAVDGICQRQFGPGTANETRYYNAYRTDHIEIDDLYAFVSMATDDNGDGTFPTVWGNGTDFDLWPYNAAADGNPWTEVNVRPNGQQMFQPGFARYVKLTGTFGWSSVPQDVVTATTLLAARVYQLSRQAPLDVISAGEMGMIRLGSRIPNVMMLLGPYQRHKISVG